MNPFRPVFPLDSPNLSRRSFIGASSSMLVALGAGRAWSNQPVAKEKPSFQAYPFQLGVASGDPSADGFVIWTRLAPEPLAGGGMPRESVWVHWQVAEDEAMTKVVASGKQIANPDWAHSVHVEVTGLKPDRWYWYQFKAGAEISQRGRTRTLESPDRAAAQTSPLKMTFASCQHYEGGFYTAYQHMLAEAPDLVLHLGDYIYEGSSREGQVRKHNSQEIITLEDYRNRHAQYKSDPSLQAMHAAAPWVVTWDDHEFDNNYAGDIPEEKGPASKEDFLLRRAAAYQAYYEHMPLRAACIPKGPGMKLYRSVRHGSLVDFHVLDTRQHRTDQPNRDRPGPASMNPDGTMLGAIQRDWLLGELKNSRASWNVLAQQVMMARVDRTKGPKEMYSMDQWPGYEVERQALLRAFMDLKVSNPVVLTGDIHTHWANELPVEPSQADAPSAGTEFVCTSITSKGDGTDHPAGLESMLSQNPFVKYHGDHRGYVSCVIDSKSWRSDFRTVDYVTRPGAPLKTQASFVVESGRAVLNKA
ncbi:alkaline phosphatase D family protein [Luteolibacter flavescens]|uniref:Alkaline phosphatase D family protein n=1 Tax=Luteolibacter flavescens TaxID=1859460 RepID=A0ABT3FVF7_9BACT|nr:alkaline phosphatase D family protein [Luteolibacter flavescens]MCW1887576.1 alkaline phosphatase D family protein [Luteolibacter flavescens]